jgi:hypothetical protein
MVEDTAETFLADEPHANVLMTVEPAAPLPFSIVEVDDFQAM